MLDVKLQTLVHTILHISSMMAHIKCDATAISALRVFLLYAMLLQLTAGFLLFLVRGTFLHYRSPPSLPPSLLTKGTVSSMETRLFVSLTSPNLPLWIVLV